MSKGIPQTADRSTRQTTLSPSKSKVKKDSCGCGSKCGSCGKSKCSCGK
jgi:bacterioferritin-associated ferredoxin